MGTVGPITTNRSRTPMLTRIFSLLTVFMPFSMPTTAVRIYTAARNRIRAVPEPFPAAR